MCRRPASAMLRALGLLALSRTLKFLPQPKPKKLSRSNRKTEPSAGPRVRGRIERDQGAPPEGSVFLFDRESFFGFGQEDREALAIEQEDKAYCGAQRARADGKR